MLQARQHRVPAGAGSQARSPARALLLQQQRCRAAAAGDRRTADLSSPASSSLPPNASSSSSIPKAASALQQQQRRSRQLPVATNHTNNAVPMPRSTAAAATAVVAAPTAKAATPQIAIQQPAQHPPLLQLGPGSGYEEFPCSTPLPPRRSPKAAAAAHNSRLSRRLTNSIMDCGSVAELQQLYRQHVASLNLIHISAVFKQLATFVEQQTQTQQQQTQTQTQQQTQQQQTQTQRAAAVSWGQAEWQRLQAFVLQLERHSMLLLGRAQVPHATAAVQMLQAASSPMHHQQQQPEHSFGSSSSSSWDSGRHSNSSGPGPLVLADTPAVQPQQLSTICWSCARLGHSPSASWWSRYWAASSPLLHTYSSRELATAISAAGKLQQVPPATWMAGFEAACVAAGGGLSEATPQELCMLLQGVAVLRLQPGQQWVRALQASVLRQLHRFGPRDISQVLWGHASLCLAPPPAWLSAVLAAAAPQLPRFSARDTAMLLWALAALGHCPQPEHLGALLRGLSMSSVKLKSATPQDLAHIAWAVATFSKLQAESSSSTSSSTGACAGISDTQLQSWFKLSWQLTTTQQQRHGDLATPPSRSRHTLFGHHQQPPQPPQQQQRKQQQQLSCIDAAQMLWAASQLDRACWPSDAWMAHFWSRQLFNPAQQANAQSVTVTLWASCRMGHRPPATFLMAAVPVLQRQLAELQPPAACQLLCVLAQLRHRPNPSFMEQLLSRLQLDSHLLQPRAFACVLWSLGRLGYQPGGTWWATLLLHLEGLVGQLGQRELANVVFGLSALGLCSSSRSASGSGSSSGACHVSQQLRQALLQRAAELGVVVPAASSSSVAVSGGAPDNARQLPLQQLLVHLL